MVAKGIQIYFNISISYEFIGYSFNESRAVTHPALVIVTTFQLTRKLLSEAEESVSNKAFRHVETLYQT